MNRPRLAEMVTPNASLSDIVRRSFALDDVKSIRIEELGQHLKVAVALGRFDRQARQKVSAVKNQLYRDFPEQSFDFVIIDESPRAELSGIPA